MRKLLLSLLGLACAPAFGDVIKTVQAVAADQTVTLRIFIAADGTFSDGLRMNALPHAMATGTIHIGTMTGKLNGVMPAHTPTGWRTV